MLNDVGDGRPALLEREREVSLLDAALTACGAGGRQVVLIEGEPGVGKSSLLRRVGTAARERGFAAVDAACDELDPRPFGALLDAFRITASSPDVDRRLLAELLSTPALPARPLERETLPAIHYRAVEMFGSIVERMAAKRPAVIAVDDLQWADPSSLLTVRAIARRVEHLPVCLVCTLRPGGGGAVVDRIVDGLVRGGAARLGLQPLTEPAVAVLVKRLLHAEPQTGLLRLAQGAGGNPLFVEELIRSLIDEDLIERRGDQADVGEVGVPAGFRQSVVRSLRQLPEPAVAMLRVAAILGTSFTTADLAAVTVSSAIDLATPVQQAAAAGIIGERDDRLAFRHALVRDAIYEDIPAPLRRELHREAGRRLSRAGTLSVAARQLGMGALPGDEEAIDALLGAAVEIAPRGPLEGVELLERAAELLGPSAPRRHAVLGELVLALGWAGRLADAEALARELLAGDAPREVAGKARTGMAHALLWQGRPADALTYALADSGFAGADRALLASLAALAAAINFEFARSRELAPAALELAEHAGSLLAACHALCAQAWVATFTGYAEDSVALGRRAVSLADAGPEVHRAQPHLFLGHALNLCERFDEAESTLQQGLRVSEEMGLAWQIPLYHAYLANRRLMIGDWDGALVEDEASEAAAEDSGLSAGLAVTMAATARIARIRLHRGDVRGAGELVSEAVADAEGRGHRHRIGLLRLVEAEVHEFCDRPREALAILEEQWPRNIGTDVLTELRWIGPRVAVLCRRIGQPERARIAVEPLELLAGRSGSEVAMGAALLCRGLVEDSGDTLIASLEHYERGGRLVDLAGACSAAATYLAETGRAGEATRIYDDAIRLFERLGAVLDADRLHAAMRAAGIRRGVRRPHVRAVTGWDSITETELRVVRLVATGMTNPEIGARLCLSRHTVATHLKHVYGKLGISSRPELAAAMARRSA